MQLDAATLPYTYVKEKENYYRNFLNLQDDPIDHSCVTAAASNEES